MNKKSIKEKHTKIIKHLKETKCKLTAARIAMISIFSHLKMPISAPELLEKLRMIDIGVNKTTVYRELGFLLKNKVIGEVDLGKRVKFYELVQDVHHHAVCIMCSRIAKVSVRSEDDDLRKRAIEETGFEIERFSLTFFGVCSMCDKSIKQSRVARDNKSTN